VERRIVLIVNPFASGVSQARLAAVERALSVAGTVETQVTRSAGHASELAREARDADAIVVYSGDGGYNEVLNGLEDGTPVGFVPGGGTSVLPRALGLSRDAESAAKRIAAALEEGRARRISLGRVNGRRFGFNAGIGVDAEAVRRIELGRAEDGRRPGDMAFALTLARTLADHRLRFEPQLEIEGYGRAGLVFVANCDPYTYVGRAAIHLVPGADFELGLDFVAPVGVSPLALPVVAARALAGRLREGSRVLHGHDLDRIVVECDQPLPLQADGEDLGDVEQAVFEAERNAIQVLV
jgi:diacylglycerol kinase family enzyme